MITSKDDKKMIKNYVCIIIHEVVLAVLMLIGIILLTIAKKYVIAILLGVGLAAKLYNIRYEYKLIEITLDILELDSVRDYILNKK